MRGSDTLLTRVQNLIDPLYLLLLSLSFLPRVLLFHPFLLITSPKAFQSAWFATVWEFLGPQMALSPEQTPYISGLFSRAKGTVLELGPGNGDQMRHLVRVVQTGQVERMVAAEPNIGLHDRLIKNAKGVGLDASKGRFIALSAGAEPASLIPALHKAGLYPTSTSGEGIFDTIITVKSMCSAPQHQMREIVSTIHTLLKPGGEFLFFEHVANDTDYLTMAWAWLLNWIWPIAMGNCHLNGCVDKVAKEMGSEWSSIDIRNAKEFMGFNTFRYVIGVCRK